MVVEEEATGAVISKEDLAASKAKAAKVAEVEKKEEEAAKPVVEKPKASLAQMRGDHIDWGFKPHPIYEDSIHAARVDTL